MGTLNIDADNTGMNDVRNVGMQLKTVTGTFDFDSSYPTGGEDFDLSSYFPKDVIGAIIFPQDGYIFEYDKANKKVKAYHPAVAHSHTALTVNGSETASDVTNFVSITEGDSTAQSGITVGNAGGGSDVDINTNQVSASPASEVPDTTDLSAVTGVSFVAFGY